MRRLAKLAIAVIIVTFVVAQWVEATSRGGGSTGETPPPFGPRVPSGSQGGSGNGGG